MKNFYSLILALCLAVYASSEALAKELCFGFISSHSPKAMAEFWDPLLTHLSDSLGQKVTPKFFDDYASVIWSMSADKLQVAWMGNKAAIEAVDRAEAEVGMQIVNASGESGYHSLILVSSESKLQNARELIAAASELGYCDGDPNSTSGHLVPEYYLFSRNGLDTRSLFKRVSSGSHEENFLNVASGKCDAATGNDLDLKRLKTRYPEQAAKVRVVWRSPLIPSSPIVWRKDLADDVKAKLKYFFQNYAKQTPGKSQAQLKAEQEVMAKLNWSGFDPSGDCQLIPLRLLELGSRLAKLRASGTRDSEEREQMIAELNAQIAGLEAWQGGEAQ